MVRDLVVLSVAVFFEENVLVPLEAELCEVRRVVRVSDIVDAGALMLRGQESPHSSSITPSPSSGSVSFPLLNRLLPFSPLAFDHRLLGNSRFRLL